MRPRINYFLAFMLPLLGGMATLGAAEGPRYEYRLLATAKTSTMEKELNEAGEAGYSFSSVMGGETGIGGKEVVVVMKKTNGQDGGKRYKLLATARTSTLEKELQAAGEEGFDYCGQTVFESAFGGREVSVILERSASKRRVTFRLLATTRTSTMEKELKAAGAEGFEFLQVMVGKTAMGGREVVSILRRYAD
ncbi:MAG: hypothetical protein NTV70_13710 [Acidobacteria bacterium]|nr:hypothetical protein [Acidobacteriota bacterium]